MRTLNLIAGLALVVTAGLFAAPPARAADPQLSGTMSVVTVTPESYLHGLIRVRSSTGGIYEVRLLSQPAGGLVPMSARQAAMAMSVAGGFPAKLEFFDIALIGSQWFMHSGSTMRATFSHTASMPVAYSGPTTGKVLFITVYGNPAPTGRYAVITASRDDGVTLWLDLRFASTYENGIWYYAMSADQAERIVSVAAGSYFVIFDGEYTGGTVARLYRNSTVYGVRQ